ncbi:fimbrial protein [Serratia fonticola]|uniref:fimbrial protein n=1 Tax=Serratia fonticola TaxID=47917 RepID=UPI0021BDE10F|nr:fimbrial protein [Serratia fonticola]
MSPQQPFSSNSMSRKKGGYPLFLLLSLCAAGPAWAAQPQGWGRVNMLGAIIETACAIDTRSRDQTINMGVLPIGQIARDGQGVIRPFSIRLVNCILVRNDKMLPDWRYFQITFDGHADTGLFSVSGAAKGIALQITDGQGHIATPGEPLPFGEITPSEMLLNYSLRLVSNRQVLRAGEYSSTIKFKMDYY